MYEKLSQAPLTSLCGMTAWPEDFTEYVRWYHLTSKLEQPCTINVRLKGVTIRSLSLMESEKVKKRESTIQGIYASEQLH